MIVLNTFGQRNLGENTKTIVEVSVLKWWAADILMKSIVEASASSIYEENIILIRADSSEAAFQIAESEGENLQVTFSNNEGKLVRVVFDSILDIQELLDSTPTDRSSIFSRHLTEAEVISIKSKMAD